MIQTVGLTGHHKVDESGLYYPSAPARLHRVGAEHGISIRARCVAGVYSSAIDYTGEKGLLDIVLVVINHTM